MASSPCTVRERGWKCRERERERNRERWARDRQPQGQRRQRRLLTSTGTGHLRPPPAVLPADSQDFSTTAAGEALLLKLQLLRRPLLTCSSSAAPGCAIILMFLFVTHPNNMWSKHTAKENTCTFVWAWRVNVVSV